MCGIVGAVSQRNVAAILLEGLKRLEYRGYDSAGMAVIEPKKLEIERLRAEGKVAKLAETLAGHSLPGNTGIAHTRWATHGVPSERNAHPVMSNNTVAVVHNGIIENHEYLRQHLTKAGYAFITETDTEVVAHGIHHHLQSNYDLLKAVQLTIKELTGAYALGVIMRHESQRLIAVRRGSPLVIGIGIDEHFIASDPLALLPLTHRFIYLEEGDIADIHNDRISIYNEDGKQVTRKIHTSELTHEAVERGNYRHYMQKEIFEQPHAIRKTLEGRLHKNEVLEQEFGTKAAQLFKTIKRVQIVACGTSYHAAMVGRYWLESLANIPCQVEIASENRYRTIIVEPNTLFVTLSQSGETADTLAALRRAKTLGYAGTLAICNVPESSLVRESDCVLMTRAGAEIGVASTKAFTTQLTALLLLTMALGKYHQLKAADLAHLTQLLLSLPTKLEQTLTLDSAIKKLAKLFSKKHHALFIGRGTQFPIALEGALKLKEISYIHAEAYPAGELKHGPLALVDHHMPVIALAPQNDLLEKLQSNLHEVNARGGQLIVFTDANAKWEGNNSMHIERVPTVDDIIAPIIYTLPLQLLAYHVAVLKGTDVDQPRNLAKSVTVE